MLGAAVMFIPLCATTASAAGASGASSARPADASPAIPEGYAGSAAAWATAGPRPPGAATRAPVPGGVTLGPAGPRRWRPASRPATSPAIPQGYEMGPRRRGPAACAWPPTATHGQGVRLARGWNRRAARGRHRRLWLGIRRRGAGRHRRRRSAHRPRDERSSRQRVCA